MPIVNISLDFFAAIIVFILFLSCLFERIKNESNSVFFLLLLGAIELTLLSDAFSWFCEGKPEFAFGNRLGTALASSFAFLAIAFFLLYIATSLLSHNRAFSVIVILLIMLCVIGIFLHIYNLHESIASFIDDQGHLVYLKGPITASAQMILPSICFISMVIVIFISKGKSFFDKLVHVIGGLFPITGAVLDYIFHGFSLTYIGLVIFAVIIYTNIYLQKRRIIAAQKTALMLSQINPHFMYNTLTTIASLCDTDPKQAQSLTIGFSSYLRQNIGSLNEKSMIPFEKEIGHVETYLRIEKARFGERINVIYQLHTESFAIPPLTIQPIVENAIKHGLTKKAAGGTVKIITYREKKWYVIEIIDDGVGYDTEKPYDSSKEHIGLLNVSERLKAICKGKLDVKSKVGVGTRVTIKIPVRKAKLDEYISS